MLKKIIFKFDNDTTKTLLNTENAITFIKIMGDNSDNLMIENTLAESKLLLKDFAPVHGIKLIDLDIILETDGKESTINFGQTINEYFYYYEYSNITGKMREHIEVRFAKGV